jgi:N-acetylneuraminic acid mutarotase
MKRFLILQIFTILVSLLSVACSFEDKNGNIVVPVHNEWVWLSGAATFGQWGIYGTKSTPASTNVPGARYGAVSWTDSSGNFWLFSGAGYDSAGAGGDLNDLWKFDGSNWTWVSGANIIMQAGAYDTKGAPADTNVPGAREAAVSWIDTNGHLWLFGGAGYDSAGVGDLLNDLWKFDGSNWTWVSGADTVKQAGIYGTKGAPADTNVPGARFGAVSWIDKSGNFWLFGGGSYDSAGVAGDLNDLWKFDGSNWTWVSGADTINKAGNYGTKGAPADTNVPGAREMAVSWTDTSGNLWLFGGYGYDSAGTYGALNDLWKFDGGNWTWMNGDNSVNQKGAYSQQNITVDTNVPGAREAASAWIDKSGFLWLFGGYGYDANGQQGNLNDLWGYQP